MARVTGSMVVETRGLALRWTGGITLAHRILAVNIFPLALLAGSVFYLDGFRSRLIRERVSQAQNESRLIARAIGAASNDQRASLVRQPGDADRVRFRLVDQKSLVVFDSWEAGRKEFLPDPAKEQGWERQAARGLDAGVDFLSGADIPPVFPGFAATARLSNDWPIVFLGPDRSHIISVKQSLPADPRLALIIDRNARDIRRLVRSERSSLGLAVGLAVLSSILLSYFLARTIARPLRLLAVAANEVRFGQAREVTVPRLPSRRDEIGVLARAVSDMTQALRSRIDAIEAFAADVSHELKNPLASLASAVETLQKISAPADRAQLLSIISEDVRRANRLISDVSDLSRVDAKIGRMRLTPVDVAHLIAAMIRERADRHRDTVPLAFAQASPGTTIVLGDGDQLGRAIENLIDNAVSFAPSDTVVRIGATGTGPSVIVTVDDDGPGIPDSQREAVFERFHSKRPDQAFGQHSGLGLAIARAIVDAHGGVICAEEGALGRGTRIRITLPAFNPIFAHD